jgi:hypothetical protein
MPWEPGKSGNPGGRPKTRHLTDILGAELEKASGKSGQSREQRMIERLVTIAITGKRGEAIQAMKLIFAYRDGLPVQPIDLEVSRAAARLAAAIGADPEFLISRAQQLAAENSGAEVTG